jgi:hypothetical protein
MGLMPRRLTVKLRLSSAIRLALSMAIVLGPSDPVLAGGAAPVRNAPTLDEFGLLALGIAVGVAGLIAVFRRKK